MRSGGAARRLRGRAVASRWRTRRTLTGRPGSSGSTAKLLGLLRSSWGFRRPLQESVTSVQHRRSSLAAQRKPAQAAPGARFALRKADATSASERALAGTMGSGGARMARSRSTARRHSNEGAGAPPTRHERRHEKRGDRDLGPRSGGRWGIRTLDPCRVNRLEVVGRPTPPLSSPRNHWS